MKVLATALIGATLIASVNVSAQTKFVAADSSKGTELCLAFASNKPLKLQKALTQNRLRKFQIDEELTCNDMSLAKFAGTYKLHKTSKFMNLDVNTSTSIQDLAMTQQRVIYVSGNK